MHKTATSLLLMLSLGALAPAYADRSAPETTPNPADESELLYNYLVGEIGARAGELPTALQHYSNIIQMVDDPYAAQRATRIALHLEDYKAGFQAVQTWLALAPESLLAHQFAAILHLRQGDLAQAQAEFEALLELVGDTNKNSLLLVASALKEEPDKDAVLQLLRNMLDTRPDDAHAHYAVAAVEVAQKRYPEAEQSLRKAIALDAGWPLPHILLGEVLAAQDKKDQALQHLADSVQKHPDETVLRHAYARQLIEAEQFIQALAQFRRLHEQNPQNAEISYGLAILATQQEAWDEARGLWQDLRGETKFYADATYFLGQVEEATGNTALAIGLYNSVTSAERRVDAAIRSSSLLAETNRLQQAREQLRQLRADYPARSADIYLAEVQILVDQPGDSQSILDLLAEALAAHPQHNDLQYSRGLYLANQQRYAEMEADFMAVLERDAQHAETLNALGYTWADRNIHLDKAQDYIQRALELRPNDAAVLDSMGWLHYRLGDLAQAEDYIRRAFERFPDEEIAAHLGEILWIRGEHTQARAVWQKALEEKPDSKLIKNTLQRLDVAL